MKEFIEVKHDNDYAHNKIIFFYKCKVCGHSLKDDDYNYCPYCGANLDNGRIPLSYYTEGFRNGLTSGKMIAEEGVRHG